MSVYPNQRASELFGLLFIATSLLLLLSLATYDPADPSLNVDSSTLDHSNYVGKIGAWASDLLLQILGWAAFCLPIPLFLAGYKRMRGRTWVEPFLKFFGVSCLIVSFSTILALLTPVSPEKVNFTPGGIVGILLSDRLVMYLNRSGSLVVVATVLVLSLVLTTRFSLDQLLARSPEYHFSRFPPDRALYRQGVSKERPPGSCCARLRTSAYGEPGGCHYRCGRSEEIRI